tara:strand:+ start:473 stop:673 length:201 start_codon:yes stop_codon:yes gene_type:complete
MNQKDKAIQKAIKKYEKRFHTFMAKLQKDLETDKALKSEVKEWNVFAGMCVMMVREINRYLKSCKK